MFLNRSLPVIRFPLLIILSFAFSAFAQDYPKEIRGYKVYNRKISVKTASDKTVEKDKPEVVADVGALKLTDVSLSGATLEITTQIKSKTQSGTVDFLAFKDFRVGGFNVEIEEYKTSFVFVKNQTTILPKPVKIRLATVNAARGALRDGENKNDEWTVTGTIFVFGRFKKFGFRFKRVVPVEINLKIKNPLVQ